MMTRSFGCAVCCGEEPPGGTGHLETVARLIDHSHFEISLHRCSVCGQRFVQIWTELVNWSGGDDAQYTDLVPVDEAEAERIRADGEHQDLGRLGSLGSDRRYLSLAYPSRGGSWLEWRTGEFPVMWGG